MESSRVRGHVSNEVDCFTIHDHTLSQQVLLNLWVLIAYNIFGGLQPLLVGKPLIEQDVPTVSVCVL